MSTFEAMLPAVMIGGSVVDEGHVIAIIIFRDNNLSLVCFDNEIIELKLTYML